MNSQLKNSHREAALQLLQKARLPQDEVDSRLKTAMSPAYWKQLNPRLSVNCGRTIDSLQGTTMNSERQRELLCKLAKEGYIQAEALVSSPTIDRMRECIELLRTEDWPAVFAFVYDEFWLVTRIPCLVDLLSAALGSGYKQIPHVWGHYVRQRVGAGWRPHTDGYKKRNRLTVWTALSDATLENGCIYLIPRDRSPDGLAERFPKRETVTFENLQDLLQGARALPVRAGTLLCWNHDVIHWGASSLQAEEPRISVSQEFIAQDVETSDDERPLLDPHGLPGFGQRLLVIGRAIAEYQRFEPLVVRYLDFANRLVAEAN